MPFGEEGRANQASHQVALPRDRVISVACAQLLYCHVCVTLPTSLPYYLGPCQLIQVSEQSIYFSVIPDVFRIFQQARPEEHLLSNLSTLQTVRASDFTFVIHAGLHSVSRCTLTRAWAIPQQAFKPSELGNLNGL
jgi:hypothetical protein